MNDKEYYSRLLELVSRQAKLWQVSIVRSEGSTPARPGMKMAIPLEGKEFGNLGGGEMEHHIIKLIRAERPQKPLYRTFILNQSGDTVDEPESTATSMICGGKVSVYVEALFRTKQLYVIGAGHCGKALGHLAKLCGFAVTLIDNRAEILEPLDDEVRDRAIFNDYSNIESAIEFSTNAHIVIMTHGHVHDKQVLEQCLDREFAYLGMIGSRQKVLQTFARMMDQGIGEDQISRVHAPIGIPIGSQTPYEIAVSIMAEIIALRNASKQDSK